MIAPIQQTRQRGALVPATRSADDVHSDDTKAPADQDGVVQNQAALLAQQNEFNFQLQERAELMREFNELRALQMQQLKLDDEIVKKWIDLI
ncbi:MAG: hypothetical protein JO024_07930 [Candidatus Eremiobacteraeota bacterium]|nr:hypothetical protein [Candidatus Eremiobacteraeota bacterium]